jgi:hypothetical protein
VNDSNEKAEAIEPHHRLPPLGLDFPSLDQLIMNDDGICPEKGRPDEMRRRKMKKIRRKKYLAQNFAIIAEQFCSQWRRKLKNYFPTMGDEYMQIVMKGGSSSPNLLLCHS